MTIRINPPLPDDKDVLRWYLANYHSIHPNFRHEWIPELAVIRPAIGNSTRFIDSPSTDPVIQQFADDKTEWITISLPGLTGATYPVCRYVPQEGDSINKSIRLANGETGTVKLPPYGIKDLEVAKKLIREIHPRQEEYVEIARRDSCVVVTTVYIRIFDEKAQLSKTRNESTFNAEHFHLLDKFLTHLNFIFHGIGTAFISGETTLGIKPNPNVCGTYGKVLVPRMVVEQISRLVIPMRKEVGKELFNDLQKIMLRKDPRDFFIVYLLVFVELHTVTYLCRNRRQAVEHFTGSVGKEFTYPDYVEQVQWKALALIAHFRVYTKLCLGNTKLRQLYNSEAPKLPLEQAKFISDCAELVHKSGIFQNEQRHPDETLYFIAQMHDESDSWQPWPRYSAKDDCFITKYSS